MDELSQTRDLRALEAREAIRAERERRGYAVIVPVPRQIGWVAQMAVPKELSAFGALTQCTEVGKPRHAPYPCMWTDVAFFHKATL